MADKSLAREERAVRGSGGGVSWLEVVVRSSPGDGVAAHAAEMRAAGARYMVASAILLELPPTRRAAEAGLPEPVKIAVQEGVAAVIVGAPGGVGGAAGGVLGAGTALNVARHAPARDMQARGR
jgi:hypothetical protein